MSMRCAIGGHRPAPNQVYNSGYYFSACARCGESLVRSARGDWRRPPLGHRIVWKPGRHMHSIEADYSDFLPVAMPTARLPALPGRFASRRRDLVRLERIGAGTPAASRAAEGGDSANYRCPRLLLMAVMLGAGLKMLLTFGGAR